MQRTIPVTILTIAFSHSASGAQLPTPMPTSTTQEAFSTSRTTKGIWFPIKTQEDAQKFWQGAGTQFLTSGAILIEDKVFGANLELLSDIVGLFRVGVGVTASAAENGDSTGISSSADGTEAKAAITRLANSGGTVRVTASLPLLFRAAPAFNSTWALVLSLAGGTESPQTGGFLEDPAVTGQVGLELFYQRTGLDSRISFQFGANARLYAFNDTYGSKADISETTAFLLSPRVGFVLLEKTRIDLLWRPVRSAAFDNLGRLAVTIQQVAM